MKLKQSYEYTGSGEFTYDNVLLSSNGIALFDKVTGLGGIGYVPYDGSTVIVKAGDPSSEYLDFEPGLNNTIYYLVTDQEYTEKDSATIKSLATAIPVYFNGTDFEGQFVFNNPNNYENLYLMWDYEDSIGTGTASYNGISKERSIALNLGSDIGLAGVSTQVIDEPTRFKVEWNGAVILDTGYIGLNSVANYNALIAAGVNEDDISLQKPLDGLVNNGNGKLLFDKYSSVDDARVIVDSPLANTIWILNRVSPSLKPFYIDTVDADTKANACTQCPSRQYYHNGIGVLPAVNDRIYITSDGSQVYNGNDSLHMIDTALCTVPTSAGKSFVGVDTSGNVVSINPCDCFEYAEPFIYQENISIDSLDPVNIPIQTLGNPESFSVVSNCVEYIVNGGTTSTLITYTDCNSNAVTLTVGATLVRNICALSTPTIVRGDGSVVSNGTCLSHIFPKGISFSEGAIIGNPVEELSFSFTINATNCFGTSPDRTINVDIKSSSYYKPFLVDVKNFKTQSSDACQYNSNI
jgi:hypothetical protein